LLKVDCGVIEGAQKLGRCSSLVLRKIESNAIPAADLIGVLSPRLGDLRDFVPPTGFGTTGCWPR